METEESILKESELHAKNNGFKVNPDKKIADIVIKGLLRNHQKYGYRYCPCRRITGDKMKDRNIICPCKYHYDEIKKDGHCHCFLFVK